MSQYSLQTGGNKKQSRKVVKVTCDTVPLTLKNSPCASWQVEPARQWHGASDFSRIVGLSLGVGHPLVVLPDPRTPAHPRQPQECPRRCSHFRGRCCSGTQRNKWRNPEEAAARLLCSQSPQKVRRVFHKLADFSHQLSFS